MKRPGEGYMARWYREFHSGEGSAILYLKNTSAFTSNMKLLPRSDSEQRWGFMPRLVPSRARAIPDCLVLARACLTEPER